MLYNAPGQFISTKCTVPRTGNKVRKSAKRCVFWISNLRTCAIHEQMSCTICYHSGKK